MQLTLPILVGIALADSVNLVSFGVLEQLINSAAKRKKLDPVTAGKEYVFGFILTYLILGFIGIIIISILGSLSSVFYSVLGAIIFLLGLLETNRILKISSKVESKISQPENRIKSYIEDFVEHPSLSYALGISTAIKEIVYSGGFYIGLLALLALEGATMDQYMTISFYNLIIAAPLIIMYLNFIKEGQAKDFQLPNIRKRKHMMLGVATLQTVLGIWLMFWWFV